MLRLVLRKMTMSIPIGHMIYWSGVITDKKKFVCPGSGCTAQVTCANLDEDLQDMKVVPHYRIYGRHI